ncbi:hypothetical protein KJ909_01250 [Patescibacteria group bacterium]|nr:hypothetical protein [Patescibacteria group bacterium]
MRQNQESIETTLELIKRLGFDAENSLDVIRPFGRGKSEILIPSQAVHHQFGLTSSPSFITNPDDFLNHQFLNPCWAGKIAVNSAGNISPRTGQWHDKI